MYNYLKTANEILKAFNSEKVVIYNVMDRIQAKACAETQQPPLKDQLLHEDGINSEWMLNTVARNGNVYIVVTPNEDIGFPIDSGFMVSDWKKLATKIDYFGNEDVKIKFSKIDSVYTNKITMIGSDTKFDVNVLGYNFVLKSFDEMNSYSRLRFNLPAFNDHTGTITNDQIAKFIKISSSIGEKDILLFIKNKKLYGKIGIGSETADNGVLEISYIDSIDCDVGLINTEMLLSIKRLNNCDSNHIFTVRGDALYFNYDTTDNKYNVKVMIKTRPYLNVF